MTDFWQGVLCTVAVAVVLAPILWVTGCIYFMWLVCRGKFT